MNRAALLSLASLALAATLAVFLERETAASVPAEFRVDGLARLAGGASEAVGDAMFLKADAYYHGGVAEHENETEEEYHREGRIADAPKATDWIARVNAAVGEHAHYHLKADKQKELLPLFNAALRLDPHNVEAVLTTAYWLDRQLGKPEEARRVLEKGAADNPAAWEIAYRLAHLLLRLNDPAAARPWYEKSLEGMGADKDAPDYLRRNASYSLGECYERAGDAAKARASYENALKWFKPGDPEGLKKAILEKLGRSS